MERTASDSAVGSVPNCSSLWNPFLVSSGGVSLRGSVDVLVYLVGNLVSGRYGK